MEVQLKILILEDNPDDAEIVQRLLLKTVSGAEFNLAIDRATFMKALNQFKPDIILSDHSLPQFDSTEALAIARKRFPGIPFIMVTGAVSEEFAANIMKAGADDYILKDRLNRLPASIENAIHKKRSETEKQEAKFKTIQSEANLRAIFENTSEGFLLLDKEGIIKAINIKVMPYAFFIKNKEIHIGDLMLDLVEDNKKAFFKQLFSLVITGERVQYEIFYDVDNNNGTWIDFSAMPVIEHQEITGICFTGRDITQKKIIEQEREFERNNLAALINNTIDLMWSVDTNFRLITSNNAFNKMMKKRYGITIKGGNNILIEQYGAQHIATMKKCYERAFRGESFAETIHLYERWCTLAFYPIYNKDLIIGTACFSHDITEHVNEQANLKLMEEEILNQKVQEQKKITRLIIKAEENERNHLGEELHDNINQLLAGAKLYLNIAANTNAELKNQVQYPIELIDTSIEEIRLLCSKLVTPLKDVDLEELLSNLLSSYNKSLSIQINFAYNIPDNLLSDDLKLNIFRILQEQVNNIWKYSQAKNVTVSLSVCDTGIHIIIADDGKGFDVAAKRNGIGISNMINRVESFNGKVDIVSSAGNGCKVDINIPL